MSLSPSPPRAQPAKWLCVSGPRNSSSHSLSRLSTVRGYFARPPVLSGFWVVLPIVEDSGPPLVDELGDVGFHVFVVPVVLVADPPHDTVPQNPVEVGSDLVGVSNESPTDRGLVGATGVGPKGGVFVFVCGPPGTERSLLCCLGQRFALVAPPVRSVLAEVYGPHVAVTGEHVSDLSQVFVDLFRVVP